jgi:hypothetical protein
MNEQNDDRIKRRVYKISSPTLPTNMVYYGSTCKTINIRLSRHLSSYRKWKDGKTNFCASFSIFDACDDYVIDEIEVIDDCTKREIEARENTYIIGNPCINRNKSFTTAEHKKQQVKDCWNANRKAYNESVKRCWTKNKAMYLENRRKAVQLLREQEAQLAI